MKKKIFILNGVHSAGKDTFVEYLKECGVKTFHYSYVSFTKAMLACWLPDIGTKTIKMRKLLCDVNKALEEYDDIPFKDCLEIAEWFMDDEVCSCLVIDCREPSKIERLKQALGAETIFIKSDKPIIANNPADMAVSESYEYDYVIDNTGTLDDLEAKTKIFVDEVIKRDDRS